MITPELISYLEKCEELGIRKEQTMSALLSAGWKFVQVQEGFKILEARQKPLQKTKFIFPVFQLSLSLLFIVVLGTSAVVLVFQYVGQAPIGSQNLQANIVSSLPSLQTQEFEKIQQQINRISGLSDSLETYKELTGAYPQSLSVLSQTANEIASALPNSISTSTDHNVAYVFELYSNQPFYNGDFTDIYTKQPFQYSSTNNNYILNYTLHWTTTQTPAIENGFIKGWNMATKDTLSAGKNTSSSVSDVGQE